MSPRQRSSLRSVRLKQVCKPSPPVPLINPPGAAITFQKGRPDQIKGLRIRYGDGGGDTLKRVRDSD